MSDFTVFPILISNSSPHADAGSRLPSQIQPREISNAPLSPSLNIAIGSRTAAGTAAVLPEITDENLLDYLRNKKLTDSQPRIFRNITLADKMSKEFKNFIAENPDALTFNGDTFIDLSISDLYLYKFKFTNCMIKTDKRPLLWFKTALIGDWCRGLTIDGLHGQMPSRLNPVSLSYTFLRACTLRNIAFQATDTHIVYRSNFSGSKLENVEFSSDAYAPYDFIHVNFDDIQATELTFSNVRFSKNVSFTSAKIKGLTLAQRVDFSGASFDEYQPGNISLSDTMFSTVALIDINLNSENNNYNGAIFLRSLGSLNPKYLNVRLDWAEQLVNKINNLAPLSQAFSQSSTLRLSVLKELINICYAGSPLISTFIDHALLLHNKDELITKPWRDKVFKRLMSLDARQLFDYQFAINQLIKEYPELQVAFHKQEPLQTLSQYITATLVEDKTETPIHHIFYHADTGEALYIAGDDFIQLIAAKIAPTKFLLLKYSKDTNDVDCIPATPEALNNILKSFPAVLSRWMNTGKLLAPIIDTLFSSCATLNSNETKRLTTIRNHINSLLSCKTTVKMALVAAEDVNILHTVLSRYHSGGNAQTLRQAIVSEAQRRLLLADKSLTDGQLKSMVSLMLARLLTQLSTSAYCGTESDSPRPLRLLAAELLSDARHYSADIISEQLVDEWRELLVPQNKETFSCSAVISSKMAAYSPPGIDGMKISAIMRKLYPLNR